MMAPATASGTRVADMSAPRALRHRTAVIFVASAVIYGQLSGVAAREHGLRFVNDLTIVALLGLLLVYRVIDSRRPGAPAIGLPLAIACWAGAAALSGPHGAMPFVELQNQAPEILLALGIYLHLDRPEHWRAAVGGIVAACLILAGATVMQVLGSLQHLDFGGLAEGRYEAIAGDVAAWRPTGSIGDPNFYAQSLLPTAAILAGATVVGRTRSVRLLSLGALAIVASAILQTASRGALISLVLVLGAVALKDLRGRSLALMLVLLPGLVIFAAPNVVPRAVSTVTSLALVAQGSASAADSSVLGRLNEMHAAWHMFLENPWLGVGFGEFEDHYQPISARHDLLMRHYDRSAHSLYLETAAEQGVLGLTVLCGILAAAAAALRRAAAEARALGDLRAARLVGHVTLGFAAFFLAAAFLHDAYPRYAWMLLALAFGAGRSFAQPTSRPRAPSLSGA